MPTLHWIGKDKVINHHIDVPFRVLEHKYHFSSELEFVGLKDEQDLIQKSANPQHPNPDNKSGNKIIHGDNLEALKSLLPEYEGRIKCIYIDPPYNTGNENWVYNDNVNDPKILKWLGQVVGKEAEDLTRHDKWLCMMYPRLKLLHKLLADDGAIFISIDDIEQANLKLVCDEIFGSGNFVNNIIWQKKYTQSNDAKYLSDTHDFVLFYAKNKRLFNINLLSRTEEQNERYKNIDYDPKGPWMTQPLHAKSGNNSDFEYTFKNGVKWSPPKGTFPRYSNDTLLSADNENKIWFGKNGDAVPRLKKYLNEMKEGVTSKTIWLYDEVGSNDDAKRELKLIFKDNPFATPKPSTLIERILQISTNSNDIILDSFSGSGTTAHAVLNLNKKDGGNRKFICIEMEDYAETITAERVKRVIKGYGNTEGTGGSFNFYTLGQPMFLEDGNLNELVGVEKIRQYVYYTEAKQNLRLTNVDLRMEETVQPKSIIINESDSFLGKYNDTCYYFNYKEDGTTTLDHAFLATIKTKAEQYVIYADNCLLTKDYMTKHNIIFKKIPRDITKF